MKLDPRIKKDFIIFSPFAVDYAKEEVMKYINTKCYFCDDLIAYEGLENCDVGILAGFNYTECHPYIPVGDTEGYKFCLPAEFIEEKPKEEKKYRPYTIEEFCNEGFEIVVFREKDNPAMEYHVRYNGYRKCDNVYKVILGNIAYTFNDLFTDYEYLDKDGKWVPFGKRVEE